MVEKAIEQYHRTPLQKMSEATFRKLTGQLDGSLRFLLGSVDGVLSFRPFVPGDAELKDFDLLMRAANEYRAVRFMLVERVRGTAAEIVNTYGAQVS